MKQAGVYILKSDKHGKYYIGSTDDVIRRIGEHNYGKVFSTRNGRPWKLSTFIECSNLSEAKSSEYRLKSYKRKDILNKVINDRIFPWNYKRV
ncbi:MAG: GIY-YIG nuclease family protein [Candidatus Zambryskibacteria bacterium]|nr:GIY-YIG nuclease family protein [Candidatus Zambryskibacteria bacterium]